MGGPVCPLGHHHCLEWIPPEEVAEAVIEFVRPLQERYGELEKDPAEVARIIATGAARAQSLAAPVVERARRAAGLLDRGA